MNAHSLLRMLTLATRQLRARGALLGAQQVGARPHVLGTPWVENAGRLEVGDDFTIASEPVPSHLVVGPGALLKVGNRVSIGYGAAIAVTAQLTLGDDVVLGPKVMIMDTDFHDTADHDRASSSSAIVLGNRVNVGMGAVILKGAHLGDGVVVAPGSVVSGQVPAGAHVSGVPARPRRASSQTRRQLDPAELQERVLALISETFQASHQLTLSDGPHSLPAWDSLGQLRLLVALEDELGVTIEGKKLGTAGTVADVLALVS